MQNQTYGQALIPSSLLVRISLKAQKKKQQTLDEATDGDDYDYEGREAVVPAGEGEEEEEGLAAETRNE